MAKRKQSNAQSGSQGALKFLERALTVTEALEGEAAIPGLAAFLSPGWAKSRREAGSVSKFMVTERKWTG
jgi:hypothetical protein